ncbi:dihydrolipoamide acetyltransferase family protein [Streptomyces sp. HK10]|uniref:dihydrolipoamide acetyltransferase family protein n=1 Tax=Streptomyces sp. HK10 TaxID=3373255 RepID=UPI003747824A
MTATLTFRMPDVGEGLVEAEILAWLVAVGDTVTDGQPVCEVETAKAAVELPIPYDGTVAEILSPPGTTVEVGAPIITVRSAGAGRDTEPAAGPAAPGAPEPEPSGAVLVGYGPRTNSAPTRRRRKAPAAGADPTVTATVAAPAPTATVAAPAMPVAPAADVPTAAGAPTAGVPVRAKPPVRKLAKELGVDLSAVPATGPHGVVTREDVLAAAAPEPVPEPAPAPAPRPAPVRDGAHETRIPVRGVRRATARAMVASAFTAPHVTEFIDVDVSRTMKLVRRLRNSGELGEAPVGPLLFVAAAYLAAVRRHPAINASWDEENQEIVLRHQVNLGIAAATERGLIVPNIKDAGRLTLAELADALGALVRTARAGRAAPGDLAGGTTTITNIGVYGVDGGTPLLNPGEAAILAVGAIRTRPWTHKGRVVPREVATLSLSFDHRLVDGELGSKVLADTAAVLEHPRRLLWWR